VRRSFFQDGAFRGILGHLAIYCRGLGLAVGARRGVVGGWCSGRSGHESPEVGWARPSMAGARALALGRLRGLLAARGTV
jgi:hypothetical protein